MKKVLIVLFITINITLSIKGTTYYVSPTGNDGAAGTITAPWATWQYAFNKLSAGDILYVRGGTYSPSGTSGGGAYVGARIAYKNGTSANLITISAYGTEVPVLDCSNITQAGWKVGILVDGCSYVRFKGLTVQNVNEHGYGSRPADGWVGGGSNHITLEQCTLTRCGGGFSFGGSCDYIYFTNCDSYNNCDLLFGETSSGGSGGYCNGFGQNGNAGTHVFYQGCRAWNNSDDGYDNMGGAGYITYNNCWAFENGHTAGDWTDITGDGDGFKLGLTPEPKETGAQRICNNCVSWDNDLGGFDESQDNGPVCDMVLYNCTAYNNKGSGFGFYSTEGSYSGIATLKNCISYKNDVNGGGRQNIYLRSNCALSNNSWQSGTVTDADFVSLSATDAKGPRKDDGSLPDLSFMHLAAASRLIDAGTDVGLPYYGNAPDIGAFETAAPITVIIPVYVSSLIENSTPAVLQMTYNTTLANVVPAASAFSVQVNSVARVVSSVAVSGSKVSLTLQSPVKFGEVVTVSYTKPSANPLQTGTGGQAINISLKPVTNNLIAAPTVIIPVYVSSLIENSTPAVLQMTYNTTLANVVPAASAFSVQVNSVARVVSSVAVSGSKVLLTLQSPVKFGEVVTVSYTKPSANPLQTGTGGQAINISLKPVTNNLIAAPTVIIPVYVSSLIENSTPAVLQMTYNTTLANVVPATGAFSVKVNSVARFVRSVSISGSKVLLTLQSPVKFGEVVTVSYTKPSTNPLQTGTGGQAINISVKPVTNNLTDDSPPKSPPGVIVPVYVSSLIGSTEPTILEMTYNSILANVVPSTAAFSVLVNSAARVVSSVAISGSKVLLTLQSPVKFGEIVSVSYTKPSANPLQTSTGGLAINISLNPVANNLNDDSQPISPVITLNNLTDGYAGFIYEIEPFVSYDLTTDVITYQWNISDNVAVSSTNGSKIQFLAPSVNSSQTLQFQLDVSVGTTVVSKTIPINILPYKPDLEIAKMKKIRASSSLAPDAPVNVTDGNTLTKWTANGDNQWLYFTFTQPFKISHLEIAFLSGQKYSSFFDIYASKDSITWQPVLTNSTSCNFSGNSQVFVFPEPETSEEYSYLKYIGHGNSLNNSNIVSEFKVFGTSGSNVNTTKKSEVVIYPNPVRNMLNISMTEPTLKPDKVRIIDYSGKIMIEKILDPELKNLQIPVSLKSGLYIVELEANNVFQFAQSLIVSN